MKKKLRTKKFTPKMSEMTFGKTLEAQRLAGEMTLKEFSSLLKISIASLADLESGRRIPTPSRAVKIARKIGAPESYWVQLCMQDKLREERINLKVIVAQ
ncbi:MAG: helix-turn-helix transcriptional regulator [Bdellovibrio sp.]|nr:helix-turn-helix transcriptional regulator [Bdellovibrio sp.]